VNCDLMDNKNSAVIKLETRIVNMLRQMLVKYYTAEILAVECILTVTQESLISGHMFICNFSLF
jgi:hypothetical protein